VANSRLLPPNSTPLERALVDAITPSIEAIPVDYHTLWDPAACPIQLLPWLAWAWSIDSWDPEWPEEEKRSAVAGAIAAQRRKGTRGAVEEVLASFGELLELVEWFEASPQLDPYTFEVRLPLVDSDGVAGGPRVSAGTARAIIREVGKAKPARAHFALVQQLEVARSTVPVGAGVPTGYFRLDAAASADGVPWESFITDGNGEPLHDGAGEFLEFQP
jgi:phage tail P2-like protein